MSASLVLAYWIYNNALGVNTARLEYKTDTYEFTTIDACKEAKFNLIGLSRYNSNNIHIIKSTCVEK